MAKSSFLEKLISRRQQCCRAFSTRALQMSSAPRESLAQLDLLAALRRGQEQPTSRPAKQTPEQLREGRFAFARETLQMGSMRATSQPSSNNSYERAMASVRADDLAKQLRRRWRPGDVYAPHDLSFQEQEKIRKQGRQAPGDDVFDLLGLDPVKEYKNFALMSEYMSDTGRIRHSKHTGLRPKNQRKIAKAIRRAIGLGIMPSVHKHPEVLERTMHKRGTLF